ncbi:hypothetical protein Bca52824_023320 [Brassica carinata]|uniref:Uncharacterized protein n=1 Tax=Brassica carinata TaxID=52824 RepID=A0A8X7VHM2_BRACI|nr:hypothetical protein Bca52824_023320 [Brassica carinata]
MVTQTTVLALTDDVVLNVSSVLAIMKELGKEGIERCSLYYYSSIHNKSGSFDVFLSGHGSSHFQKDI